MAKLISNLKEHKEEIKRCLNMSELWSHLIDKRLIKKVRSPALKSTDRLLALVESKGERGVKKFIQCLNDSSEEHLGHAYALSLLQDPGRPFAPQSEINASEAIRVRCEQRMTVLQNNVDVYQLVPHLRAYKLLTSEETQRLMQGTMTSQKRFRDLFTLLDSKGPKAYLLFANCLRDDDEHRSHQEVLTLLQSELSDASSSSESEESDDDDVEQDLGSVCVGAKRKADYSGEESDHDQSLVKVTKISPKRIEASGILSDQEYFDKIKAIRKLHYEADWKGAEAIVEECRLSGNVELYVAVMLRNCSGYVTQKNDAKVHEVVDEAKRLCHKIESDNRSVLQSRCYWMQAKHSRYTKQMELAQFYIDTVMALQANLMPGEDTVLAYYCKACILSHYVAERWSDKEAEEAKECLRLASDHAVRGDYGVYISHHKIRLAQLCLHSSPHHAGVCINESLIKEASRTLQSIHKSSLLPRTKCLYYCTMSDLFRNQGQLVKAKDYAQKAHRRAKRYNFQTELQDVQIRLQALQSNSTDQS